jgi:transcriptional regulator of nitric oxide reductase
MTIANTDLKMVAQSEQVVVSSNKGRRKIELFLAAPPRGGEQPHEALANLRSDEKAVKAFAARWGELLAKGKAKSLNLQVRHGQVDLFGEYISPELELRDRVRDAWRGEKTAVQYIHDSVARYMKTVWEFHREQIQVAADDLWSTICLLFLQDRASRKIAICANPDCQSPYFIKKRATQKYCESGPCTEYAQRRYALDWWNRKGKKNRAEGTASPRRRKAQ